MSKRWRDVQTDRLMGRQTNRQTGRQKKQADRERSRQTDAKDYRAVGVWHGVERSHCQRKLVQDEEISVILKHQMVTHLLTSKDNEQKYFQRKKKKKKRYLTCSQHEVLSG